MPNYPLDTDPERERLVFGHEIDWDEDGSGGIVRMRERDGTAIGPETLLELVESGYAAQSDRQNAAPTIADFLAFAAGLGELTMGARTFGSDDTVVYIGDAHEKYAERWADTLAVADDVPPFTLRFEGYMVSPERGDARVSIEGYVLRFEGDVPVTLVDELERAHGGADDFDVDESGETVTYRTWWD